MLPNISADIVEKQKTLQPGTCMAFGSAFKIPTLVNFVLPSPIPESTSVNIKNIWF